ncbi:hypothetical protein RDWZM_009514 [Blomia tropicalis]|uniref:Uncharacterized protein n=1 Tax=Blomia tropicalis TaxID=40697 RepID=A0A9Q0M6H0_BLOTA|nr:hypothetical protein RDWZM_009514 [Blomia tropicalis]
MSSNDEDDGSLESCSTDAAAAGETESSTSSATASNSTESEIVEHPVTLSNARHKSRSTTKNKSRGSLPKSHENVINDSSSTIHGSYETLSDVQSTQTTAKTFRKMQQQQQQQKYVKKLKIPPRPKSKSTVAEKSKKRRAKTKEAAALMSKQQPIKPKTAPKKSLRVKSKSISTRKPMKMNAAPGGKTLPMNVRKMVGAPERKSKGQNNGKTKSKQGTTYQQQQQQQDTVEKSVRLPPNKQAIAAQVIQLILENLSAVSNVEQSSSDSSNASVATRSKITDGQSRVTHATVKQKMAKAAATAAGSTSPGMNAKNGKTCKKVLKKVTNKSKKTLAKETPITPKVVVATSEKEANNQTANSPAAGDDKPMTNEEMEDLNDEMTDLNTSVGTLRHSYGSIIRSLANMQNRRAKRAALAPVTTPTGSENAPGGAAPPTIPTIDEICARVKVDYATKYNMDRFLNADSRDAAFDELFREVTEINATMATFRSFFNAEGYFQRDLYQKSEWQLTRPQFRDCLKYFQDLSKVITTVLKAYNTDLLDMFRINSST